MMKEMVRKIIIGVAASAVVVGGVVVYANIAEPSEKTELGNPNLYDLKQDDVVKMTGITLTAPEHAKDISYSVIDYAGDHPIAEMKCKMDNKEIYLRAQNTDKKALVESEVVTDGDASSDDLVGEVAKMGKMAEDPTLNFSGINTDWNSFAYTMVGDYEAASFGGKDGAFVVWINPENKTIYNLCSVDGVDTVELQEIAAEMI